ncbi:Hypothetical protein, putative [Bodo saltans]|uniref:Uncharacterized protein n=1 Tax=Bodo saltans TaxID=75058 RepID=A0A0S4J481_BODSA|nr:Hypothetical protein, putative [Bodo saltans]|eukprot:CUG77470.1 Hypothetical protein, putative [Bodo saltans]
MMVWQELKSQKSTLEALTRHVEALVLETPTTADVGHRVTQRQKSLSPEQLQRHAEVVDQQYHNVVDRLETLSAFQRNLLLRPLPEHHPALTPITPPKTAPAHHRHSGAPSVQQRVDDLVRAAAPERKQLSAPSRPKVKVRQ